MKTLVAFCAVMLCSFAFAAKKPTIAEIHIVKVQEVTHDDTIPSFIGPRKIPETYRVVAFSTTLPDNGSSARLFNYVLACPKIAPEPGKTYWGGETYVDPSYSALRLWPAERKDVGLRGKGRVYKVVIIFLDQNDKNVGSKQSDGRTVVCDVYSAEASQPQ